MLGLPCMPPINLELKGIFNQDPQSPYQNNFLRLKDLDLNPDLILVIVIVLVIVLVLVLVLESNLNLTLFPRYWKFKQQ